MNATTTNATQDLSQKEKRRLYTKRYKENNAEKVKKQQKDYRESKGEELINRAREWRKKNPENVKKSSCRARKKNAKRILASNKKYYDKKMQADEIFAAKTKLRSAVRGAFKRIKQHRPTNTLALLGCTWEEAKAHFESLFQEGMNWSNHGEWHIDHIRPVASFGPDELHLMNHVSNLQPLWAKDNLEKSDKWD
jgi:hypothetical protein